MAEFVAPALQTVGANQNVLFTDTRVSCCDLIQHRDGSGVVKVFPVPCKCKTRFLVIFSGNIQLPTGGTVGTISLALTVDGEPDQATVMSVTPAAVEQPFNVASSAYIYVDKCCSTIGVRNINTEAIEVLNANLIVVKA